MRILCVDPNPRWLAGLRSHVTRLAPTADIACCCTPDEALRAVQDGGCDILLTEIDLKSPRTDGFLLAGQIASLYPRVNIIFVSDRKDDALALRALELHASGYLRKPCEHQNLADEFNNLRYQAV
ncbi:MAG: response regulator [Oscillospiraceae bacterium]|nr:response regulator [Oscillospiraceae bacterium]